MELEKRYKAVGRDIVIFRAHTDEGISEHIDSFLERCAYAALGYAEREVVPLEIQKYNESQMKRKRSLYPVCEVSFSATLSERGRRRALFFELCERNEKREMKISLRDDMSLRCKKIKIRKVLHI